MKYVLKTKLVKEGESVEISTDAINLTILDPNLILDLGYNIIWLEPMKDKDFTGKG